MCKFGRFFSTLSRAADATIIVKKLKLLNILIQSQNNKSILVFLIFRFCIDNTTAVDASGWVSECDFHIFFREI